MGRGKVYMFYTFLLFEVVLFTPKMERFVIWV